MPIHLEVPETFRQSSQDTHSGPRLTFSFIMLIAMLQTERLMETFRL